MCYNVYVWSAPSFRANSFMSPRSVVLLNPLGSIRRGKLPSYNSPAPITPLDCALLQVFILKNFKPFRMNTYKKTGGRGVLWLTKNSSNCCLPGYGLCFPHTSVRRAFASPISALDSPFPFQFFAKLQRSISASCWHGGPPPICPRCPRSCV